MTVQLRLSQFLKIELTNELVEEAGQIGDAEHLGVLALGEGVDGGGVVDGNMVLLIVIPGSNYQDQD